MEEALRDQNWTLAMKEEVQTLEKNKNWESVPKLKNVIPVGCQWVFTFKYRADGYLNVTKQG